MLRNRLDILLVSVIALLLLPAPGWTAQGGRASPPPPSGDWTVTDATSISSTTIVLSGNLTIMPGGILTLDRVVLVVDCKSPGQFCITVRAGGELHLRQSNLTAQNLSKKFDFTAMAGSVLEMTKSEVHGAGSKWTEPAKTSGIMVRTNSASFTDTVFSNNTVALDIRNCSPTVTNCTFFDNLAACVAYNSSMNFRNSIVSRTESGGLFLHDRTNITISGCNFSDNFRPAIYANHSSVTISRNAFYQNYISVQSDDSAFLRLENNTFTDDKYIAVTVYRCPNVYLYNDTVLGASRIGLRAEACRVVAVNSTFGSGLYDVQLQANSTGELVNCTFTRHNLNLQDPDSRIKVFWYLGVMVRWWSNQTPVQGADITITNASGNVSAKGTTDGSGRFAWGVLQNYTLGIKTVENFGPYNVTARRKGLTSTASAEVNRSLDIELLFDDIGPAIRVDFPQNGAFLNLTRVPLKGLSWDNETNVASVECKVDNGSFVSAAGTSYWEFTTGILVNGPHSVTIRARDTSNNTNQVTAAFTLDTFAPVVTVSSPVDGGFTLESNVTVVGTTEKNATVTVNGTGVNVSASTGDFNITVELNEGENLIEVVATDRAQNRGVKVVRFRKDTMVTPIDIFPRNGTWTNQTEIDLFGRIEENCTMVIRTQDAYSNFSTGEIRRNVTNGTFSVKIAVHNGTNLFRIDIVDGFGNNATVYLTIFQDRAAPFLNLTSPNKLETYTRERRLVVEGRTEPGATVYLNGRVKLAEEGNISWPLTLDLGENLLNITSVDAAGNFVSVVYRVILDRTPPSLVLTSPRRPSSGASLRTDAGTLKIRGTTEPDALVYITVNNEKINNGKPIPVDAFGGFRKDVQLKPNIKNVVEITAFDRANNAQVEHRVILYSPVPPLISNEGWVVIIVIVGVIAGLVAVVAWDTKKNTGRWGIKRPAWFRFPALSEQFKERARAIRDFVPKPEFGREEHETGIGAVLAEPGKEGKEPEAAGAPAPGAEKAPEAAAGPPPAPPVPPVPPLGKEFGVSEKPAGAPSTQPIPGASELPVSEPAAGAAPAAASAGPLAPGAPDSGAAPAPAQPAPPPPPPEPPKPKEVDPLAEIMGAPTKKL